MSMFDIVIWVHTHKSIIGNKGTNTLHSTKQKTAS
jgi:hypothetical protein